MKRAPYKPSDSLLAFQAKQHPHRQDSNSICQLRIDELVAANSSSSNFHTSNDKLTMFKAHALTMSSDDDDKNNNNNEKETDTDSDTAGGRSRDDDLIDRASVANMNLRNDYVNIAFLMFLYFLQGVPLGLTGSLPFILSSRKVSYSDQGTFSFAFWPFSLKLLWAPLVDTVFLRRLGRRKSWIVPMQLLMGVFMIIFSSYVHELLEVERPGSDTHRDIYQLTGIFFVLTFFCATQDIAVDGWGLTMLHKDNVGWTSTCNSTGQTAGWFLGNVVFLVFQSADFSNKYIRPLLGLPAQPIGVITVDSFMQFFGVVFIVSTLVVLFLKHEDLNDTSHIATNEHLTFAQTYGVILRILNLKYVRKLIFIIFTCKIAYAVNAMAYLKLIEKGVKKEHIGLLAIPLTPFEILLPVFISKYTNGPNPLGFYTKAYPLRILVSALVVFWVWLTPSFMDANGEYPYIYFALCVLINGLQSMVSTVLSVTQTSFFTQICDKAVGGTYMTLLNTVSNIGSNWPNTLAFYIVDIFSYKSCFYDLKSRALFAPHYNNNISSSTGPGTSFIDLLAKMEANRCSNDAQVDECASMGGKCSVLFDAYYLLAVMCFMIGVWWIVNYAKSLFYLQSLPRSVWKIKYSS